MLLEKIKKFWKAGLAETIKDTAIPSGAHVRKKQRRNKERRCAYALHRNNLATAV